jgi:hypothetical protein
MRWVPVAARCTTEIPPPHPNPLRPGGRGSWTSALGPYARISFIACWPAAMSRRMSFITVTKSKPIAIIRLA